MKIDSNDIAPILTALATVLTVIGGMVTNLILTLRQGRRIEQHATEIKELKSASGTFKALSDEPRPPG